MSSRPPDPPIMVAPADEVRIPLAAAIYGLSEKAIRRKIEEGVWIEGKQYVRKGTEVWILREGVSAWVRGDEGPG